LLSANGCFCSDNKTWKQLRLLTTPPPLRWHTAVVLGTSMVVFGGCREKPINELSVYDVKAQGSRCSCLAKLTQPAFRVDPLARQRS
jgi:hypothetical protein